MFLTAALLIHLATACQEGQKTATARPTGTFAAWATEVISGCEECQKHLPAGPQGLPDLYPRPPQPPEHLYAVHLSVLDDAEKLMLQTLQGLVARTRPEVFTTDEANQVWLDDLRDHYGIPYEYQDDPWWYVDHFRDQLDGPGYILCELGQPSVNVATSLAGLLKAVAVDVSMRSKAEEHGLHQVLDVRGRDETWILAEYGDRLRRDIMIELPPKKLDGLRDYAAAFGIFVFSTNDWAQREAWQARFSPVSPVLGWGDPSFDEGSFVSQSSGNSLVTIASDWARNLSTLSAIRVERLKQPERPVPKAKKGTHYVSFIMSDGDNLQWMLNGFATDSRWYGSQRRGEFSMGWTVPPTAIDLIPGPIRWIYDHAADTSKGTDNLVAGLSGLGYLYPSLYPLLQVQVLRLAPYLERADLHVLAIMDVSIFQLKADLLDPYTRIPSVKGIIWYNYGDYYRSGARVVWSGNGKPIITIRDSMWKGGSRSTPEEIAKAISGYPRDPKSIEGYTVVNVHAWSYTLDDVAKCISLLDGHVRVVTPEQLIGLIAANVARE